MFNLYIKQIMQIMGRKPGPFSLRVLGISSNNAHRLLNNKAKSIKLSTLFDICNLLQCTPNDLFDIPDKDYEGLHASHPLRKLKKPTRSHSPAELVKTIPVERLQQANELLLKFLSNEEEVEIDK